MSWKKRSFNITQTLNISALCVGVYSTYVICRFTTNAYTIKLTLIFTNQNQKRITDIHQIFNYYKQHIESWNEPSKICPYSVQIWLQVHVYRHNDVEKQLEPIRQLNELSWFSFIKDISGDILEGLSSVVWTRRRVFSTTWWACRTPMLTSSLVLTSWPGKWRFHRWQILGMCITLHSQIINFINRVPNDWRHFTIILLHTSFHFVHEKINSEECRKIY